MSTIAPNGQIRFLSEVPIDDTYENTLYFETKAAQTTYFLGLTPVHTMTECSRVRDGVIRVNALADDILHCNYLMFQNTNFSNKWFYAFIEDVVYVNNVTSEVYYRLDEIQTWLYDDTTSLGQCFIEREHTKTDRLFEHKLGEGIEVGEYVFNDYGVGSEISYFNRYTALLFLTVTSGGSSYATPVAGAWQGNLNGLAVLQYDVQDSDGEWLSYDPSVTDPSQMNELERLIYVIDGLVSTQQSDSIVGLTLVPRDLINTNDGGKDAREYNYGINNFTSGNTLNGYTPKNKKMYNSPYCAIEVGLTDGQNVYLQPEYLPSGQIEIQVMPNVSTLSSLAIAVKNYKGKSVDYDTLLSYSQFAQCAVAIDSYKAWVAAGGNVHTRLGVGQGVSNVLTGIATALMGLSTSTQNTGLSLNETEKANVFRAEQHYKTRVNGVSGTAVGIGGALGSGGAYQIAQSLYDASLAKHLPNGMKGDINTQSLTATKKLGIVTRHLTVPRDFAESIDNYFTMFGYKVNKVDVPSLKNRSRFTYVKTKGCKVNGEMPSSSQTALNTIFNEGIRFWVSASDVGNYSAANNPI